MEEKRIYALALDPIYIGTGGYTIGRVDNTIVRDPATKIPKIPATSFAGTGRFYMTLEMINFMKKKFECIKSKLLNKLSENGRKEFHEKNRNNIMNVKDLVNRLADYEIEKEGSKGTYTERIEKIKKYADEIETIISDDKSDSWKAYWGNLISSIYCAGKDELPEESYENINSNVDKKYGHCGHCIVCKTFGFSKKDKSQRGSAFFSDLNIVFFPVHSRVGVVWVTSPNLLKNLGIEDTEKIQIEKDSVLVVNSGIVSSDYLDLGWMNLRVDNNNETKINNVKKEIENLAQQCGITDNIVIVSDMLISQIINANLEVRTSVSIDPITGAAKEHALFTSEAIPRGTIFSGEIRIMDKIEDDLTSDEIINAFKGSAHYYESFGIGGMTTRGFGRIKIYWEGDGEDGKESIQQGTKSGCSC